MSDASAERALARETLCRLLAACHYEPAPEFGEERVFESLRDAAARVDPALEARARALGEAFAGTALQDLLVDYTRLFLGPVRALAQPYESVWSGADAALMTDRTMALVALYGEAGFELDEGFRDLPDHVAAELEFLYLLIFRENQARANGDPAASRAAGELRRRFLGAHLGAWVEPFAAAVREGAQTAFYRTLADLTAAFVALERRRPD